MKANRGKNDLQQAVKKAQSDIEEAHKYVTFTRAAIHNHYKVLQPTLENRVKRQLLRNCFIWKSKHYQRFLLTGMNPLSVEHLVRAADVTPCVIQETKLFH